MLKRIVLVFTMFLMIFLFVSGCKATKKNPLSDVTDAISKANTLKSGRIINNSSISSDNSLLNSSGSTETKFINNKGTISYLQENKKENPPQTAYYNDGAKYYTYTKAKGWVETPKDFKKIDVNNISAICSIFSISKDLKIENVKTQSIKTIGSDKQIVIELDNQKMSKNLSQSSVKDDYKKYTFTYTINSDGYPVNLIVYQELNITINGNTTFLKQSVTITLTDINKYSKLDRPNY